MRQLFRTPNDPSALDESNPSTEPKRYLRIVLDKATDLPVGDQALVGGASDPYIIFEFGEHRLRSTIVTHALNPSWRREQFEFVLTESEVQEHQKLRVTVLDYDLAKKDDLLGTFEIDMAAWQSSTTLGDMAIQPYDINVPDALAKQQKHPQLHLGIALLTEVEATSTFIMQIWEHERWEPIKGWNRDHLKASKDPPVWLSETDGGKTGGANFTDAILATPAGYKEKTTWESKVAFGDGEGWTYSKSFDDVAWHDQGHLTRIARRRLWARQYVREETATELFRPATSSVALQFPAPTASTKRHLRIVLDHASDLPVGDTTSSDPYVVMECGRHKMCSPVVHGSLNPNWRRDHFEFILTDAELLEKPSLRFTIMDYDLASSDDALGTCVVDMTQYTSAVTSLDKVAIQAFPIEKAIDVASQQRNPQLHVGLAWLSEADATATYLMQVWENERWHPTNGWGHAHLTPSKDPAAWTPTDDRQDVQGGAKFNDAIGPVPNGYDEKAPLSLHVSFGDNDGWLYSATFAGPWHVAPNFTSVVHRRLLARQYDRKLIAP